jgi:hypothetical protein
LPVIAPPRTSTKSTFSIVSALLTIKIFSPTLSSETYAGATGMTTYDPAVTFSMRYLPSLSVTALNPVI